MNLGQSSQQGVVQVFYCGHLYYLAKEAYHRTSGVSDDRTPGQSDAVTAIVIAAASVEAFMNEVSTAAASFGRWEQEPPQVQAFAEILEEMEEKRSPIELKWLVAKQVLSGQPYDKGSPPWQSFATLIALRNALMHPKPIIHGVVGQDPYEPEDTRLLKSLPQHILADLKGEWISRIETRGVARWACNAAAAIVVSLFDAFPQGSFKDRLQMLSRHFTPIP